MILPSFEATLILGGIVLLIVGLEARRQIRERDVLDDESICLGRFGLAVLSLARRVFHSTRTN